MNSLKNFYRNLSRQKTIGILSIGSLGLAIAVGILIGLWAVNEFSFDNFTKDKDSIYHVYGKYKGLQTGVTFKPLGSEALKQFPEISEMCRVASTTSAIKINNVIYPSSPATSFYMVDPNFFTFFSHQLKTGDPKNCLTSPNGVIIDETTANHFFPGEDPIGKSLDILTMKTTCQIIGIMPDMPENSHLKAHIISPFLGYLAQGAAWEDGCCFKTYFKIEKTEVLPQLEKKLTNIINSNCAEMKGWGYTCGLQPLKDVHFNNDIHEPGVVYGNKTLVIIFLLTTFVILLLACINFINLFISTSFLRAKAIGIKKTLGSEKGRLVREFYTETFYYVIIAAFAGVALSFILLPLFNQLADYNLKIEFTNPVTYLILLAITSLIIVTAGTFPALYMTKFNAVDTLKGQFKGKNLSFLQKGLIITQFTASIIILASVFFIQKQVNYMLSKDLGFNKENIIYVYDSQYNFCRNFETLRNELIQHPSIIDVSFKNKITTETTMTQIVKQNENDQGNLMEYCDVYYNYFDLMKMQLVAGQTFSSKDQNESPYCILNEAAVKALGLTDPIGEKILANIFEEKPYIIKGVVKDAQTQSIHQSIMPQIYFPIRLYRLSSEDIVLFKIQGDPQEAIRLVENKWREFNTGGYPFEYHFLDQAYAQLYKTENNANQILTAAMGITLVITTTGLFAMAYYVTQRRLKEVGIRKVSGASTSRLLLLLNRDFFIWVGISFLVACPVTYYLISRWLENFTDRTSISWWVFALVGIITFMIATLTVSYQTWKAANINPIKVLKNE